MGRKPVMQKTSAAKRKSRGKIDKRRERFVRYQRVLLELAKMDDSDLESAFKKITEAGSKTLDVERVSVWLYTDGFSEVVCEDLYRLSLNSHENGLRLKAKQYPRYFKALEENRTVTAYDAQGDPRTSEYTKEYLKPLGISSLLDVPVRLHGKVVGIVSHEQSGRKRRWTLEEQDFAASIADMVSLALEMSEHKKAEAALKASEEFKDRIIESSPDCIEILDLDGHLLWMSEGGQRLLDICNFESFRGRMWLDFWKGEYRQAAERALEAAKAGGTGKFIGFFPTASGTRKWWDVIITPILDSEGKPERLLSISRDISDRSAAEDALRRAHDQLDTRVLERTSELVIANSALQAEIAVRKRAETELKILNDITQAVNLSLEPEEVYRVALDKVVELESVDMACVYLVDKAKNEAVLQDHRNLTDDFILRAGRIPYPKGVTWKVINSGKVLNVRNAQDDPDVGQVGRTLGFGSMLGTPILIEGKSIGVFWLLTYKKHQFSKPEEELLTSIGGEIATAIAKANLYRELSKKNRYEKIISTVTRVVHQSINLQEVFENAVDVISKNIDEVKHVAIHMVEEEEAVIMAYRGHPDWFIERTKRIPYPKGFTWKTIIEGKPRYCPDVDQDAVIGPAGREVGTKSYLSTPICSGGSTVGCINVHSFEKNAFDEEELTLLETVARQIETAINNARQAEDLRRSEERYRILFDQSPLGVYIFDQNFTIVDCNERQAQILKSSRDRIKGLNLLSLRDRSFEDVIIRALRGETYHREGYYEATTGSARLWLSVSVSPLRDGDGNIIAGMAVIEDITERKQAEDAIRESEDKFRNLVENTNDWVWEIDRNGVFTYVNPKASEIIGYEPARILGSTTFDFMMKDEAKRFAEVMGLFVSAQKPFSRIEKTLIHRDGHAIVLETSGSPVFDSQGVFRGYRGITRDVTERKKTEEELLTIQKLESLGVLAGGIAHDFNNLLTGVLGNISLAKTFGSLDDKTYKRISEAEKASLRARDLMEQLITFARGGVPVIKPTSIGETIKESALFALSGSNVRCALKIPEDLWLVQADEGQISQVVSNLVINADQAMPEGGVITIKAENVKTGPGHDSSIGEERYIKVTVEDHGIGIAKEQLARIFDPYFTTKEKGRGLGLTISYSIISKHRGSLGVESEIGTGSRFYFYLPATDEKAYDAKEAHLAVGTGRILVMDDEDVVRKVVGDMLSQIGYEVEFAKDGSEAIELYREAMESDKCFDVVLMDLTIPGGMGGRETIQKLSDMDPEIRAVVSSGYSNDPLMSEYEKHGFRGVVVKPYKIEELSRVVYKVMNGG